MLTYKKNLKKLIEANSYYPSLEHEACGVGFVASTEGKLRSLRKSEDRS